MSSLRIVSDNAADRATITATPAAVAGMGVDRLKTDIKVQVCRILANTATLVLTWSQAETVACVAIPACNLSSGSKIRVRVYRDAAGIDLLVDTGEQWAAPGTILANWDFRQDLNVNAFGDGAACVAVWFEHQAARRIVIDITDPNREFLDLSRLVVGGYFEPRYNASYGSSVGFEDMTSNTRTASGDMRTDWGPKHRVLDLNMDWVHAADRQRTTAIMRAGIGQRHLISVLPDNPDPVLEEDYTVYGTLRTTAPVGYAAPGLHQTQYQLEEF